MAKRRRLVAPDQSELEKIDQSFAAKPPLSGPGTPPIAQVAAESATLAGLSGVGDRVAMAQDSSDAAKWRELEARGQAVHLIDLASIEAEYLRRDRLTEDPEAMEELIASIKSHGLRTPIEVVQTEEGFGLVSGQRRFKAFLALSASDSAFVSIPAFLRDHTSSESAYVSMVEENEVRANLTHYERGRIAVLAAQQGVFDTTQAAVDTLFQSASKAKRSKIRSFALVHEALGDLLQYPTDMSEKVGLRVAQALKQGLQPQLRAELGRARSASLSEEVQLLENACKSPALQPSPSKGGRPREVEHLTPRALQHGGTLTARVSNQRLVLEIRGRELGVDDAEAVLNALEEYLD